jgi:zinc protease
MKRIYIAAIATLMILSGVAQKVDRTKPPKGGPAPVLHIGDPVMYKLPNGITVLVVENHKLPRVSATYVIDQGPILEGDQAGEVEIMGKMLEEGTTKMKKEAFDEAVDQLGANVNLSSSGGYAQSLTKYFDKAFELMADAITHPAFPEASFEKIRSQQLTSLKSNEKSAKAISARVVNALNYGTKHPNGEFETEQTLNNITLEDIKKVYAKYISPSRGYLTFVGDITPAQAKALAEKAFGGWKGAVVNLMNPKDVANPAKTEVDLVDVPNAVQSEITVSNLVRLPMSSPDYFAVLLANNILGGTADSRLFMNLREKHGFTYGAYSGIGTGRFQTTFSAAASVRNEKADSAVAEILKEIMRIRNEKATEEELKNAKALYAGSFALGLEDPARMATFASNILINNLPKDFYRTYLQKINAVTAADIQRVAQKYFNYGNTRIIVVGKAATVKPGLSKLGYAVKMYDKFAAPVTETQANNNSTTTNTNVALPAAKDIINKYINALGGTDELKKVNTVYGTGEMNMSGAKLEVVKKEMNPNYTLTILTMNGQPVVKQLYDGKTGTRSQMGHEGPMTDEELAEHKSTKGIFEHLYYNDGGYKMEVKGVEKVNGKDAYKVLITSPAGTTFTEYFDIANGLLVRLEKSAKMQGQEIQQTIDFSNFKKVGNVLFPFTTNISSNSAMGSQEMTVELKDIKLNEGVKVEDFK